MYEKLALFQTADQMAQHAGARQAVVASNVANADTPGYKAMQIASFSDSYEGLPQQQQRVTRAGHLSGGTSQAASRATAVLAEPSPNGNTVSIEDEMLSAVAASREHSRALAIYRHTMTVLRTSIGR